VLKLSSITKKEKTIFLLGTEQKIIFSWQSENIDINQPMNPDIHQLLLQKWLDYGISKNTQSFCLLDFG